MGIIDTLKYQWRTGSLLLRVIFINVGVFLALTLMSILAALLNSDAAINLLSWLQLPSAFGVFVSRPWTLLTYMFVQTNLLHLAFNMLWLYWFGVVFMMFANDRELLRLYIYGGLAGAVMFILGFATLPGLTDSAATLTGSSAAVIAVVTATSIRYREYRLNLMFFGPVALKWIGLITLGLCLIQSPLNVFPAHLGGLLAGVAYVFLPGCDFAVKKNISQLWTRFVSRFSSFSSRGSRRTATMADDGVPYDKIDEIISKVKKSGYTSLSDEEKRYLFRSNTKK